MASFEISICNDGHPVCQSVSNSNETFSKVQFSIDYVSNVLIKPNSPIHVCSCEFLSRPVCTGKCVKIWVSVLAIFSDFKSSTPISRTFAQYIRRNFCKDSKLGWLIGKEHNMKKSLSENSGWRQTVWIMIITGLPRKNLANGPFESTFEGSKVVNFQKAWQKTPAEWWIGNAPSTFLIFLSSYRSLVENLTCSTISFFMSPLVLSSFDMGPSINWVPLTLSLIITS